MDLWLTAFTIKERQLCLQTEYNYRKRALVNRHKQHQIRYFCQNLDN